MTEPLIAQLSGVSHSYGDRIAVQGVHLEIPAGKMISGIPAFDNRDWLRSTAAFRRLGEMARTVRDLERRLKELEGTKKNS